MSTQLPVRDNGFLKASDFDEPKVFIVAAAPEYKEAEKAEYGDADGKSYFYYFREEGEDGKEFTFQNNSSRLARAWNEASLEVGDNVKIQGTGTGFNRAYVVEKV